MNIVFEGGEGCGKSSVRNMIDAFLRANFDGRVLAIREPGGTPWSEKIRDIIFWSTEESENRETPMQLSPEEEILLFATARTHTLRFLESVAKETEGKYVSTSDRNFWSSLTYQVTMAPHLEEEIRSINLSMCPPNIRADLIFYFKVDVEVGLERARGRSADQQNHNDFKSAEWHRKIHERYDYLAKNKLFAKEVVIIDANQPIEKVYQDVLEVVKVRLDI